MEVAETSSSANYPDRAQMFRRSTLSFDGLLPSVGDSFIIHVNIYGSTHSSTKMKVTPSTQASSICSSICEKLGIPSFSVPYFSLIVVFVCTDNPTPVHYLRTLRPNDIIVDVIRRREQNNVGSMYLTKWFFKDIRTTPMDFEGDVSGDSSSDDEKDMSTNDLCYLSSEKSGYLLKRSSKDVNLWRRRRCIITDTHIWCTLERNNRYRTSCVALNGPVFLHEDLQELSYPFGLGVQSNNKTFFFRASSSDEQYAWFEEINNKAKHSGDNNLLAMAEVIISGEEDQKNQHCSNTIHDILQGELLTTISRERWADDKIGTNSSDNSDELWTIHSFHSNHPLSGSAMAFIVSVNEEYKEMFRKFLRPTVEDFWHCAVGIYRRFIVPQLVQTSGKIRSLCFPTSYAVSNSMASSPSSIRFISPSYLATTEALVLKLQNILSENVKWRSHEEILAETARVLKEIRDKDRTTKSYPDRLTASFWSAGRSHSDKSDPDAVPQMYIDQIYDRIDTSSSRYLSRRFSCMHKKPNSANGADDAVVNVVDYIVLNKLVRPDIGIFDEILEVVLRWIQTSSGEY